MKIPKIIFNHIEGGGEVNILPVMNIEGSSNLEEIDLPQTLPILALRNAVIFPGTVLPITVSRDKSLKLIKAIYKSTKIIGTVTQIDIKVEDPKKNDLYHTGTSAKILKIIEMPDGGVTVILQGIKRFTLKDIIAYDPYMIGSVDYLEEKHPAKNDTDMEAVTDPRFSWVKSQNPSSGCDIQ